MSRGTVARHRHQCRWDVTEWLTTGKPVKIISRTSIRKPAHYFEIQIDTKRNHPEIVNGKGNGEDIPAGEKGHAYISAQGIEWVSHYPDPPNEVRSGTRVTIELEGRFVRGRGSVDEYLEQTAIANPHVTIHYIDPETNAKTYSRSTTQLPAEPVEIKPHPYGIELGQLITMLRDTDAATTSQFLTTSFSRVTPFVAQKICETAKITTRSNPRRIGRQEADATLYQAIQVYRRSAHPQPIAFLQSAKPSFSKGCINRYPASSSARRRGRLRCTGAIRF